MTLKPDGNPSFFHPDWPAPAAVRALTTTRRGGVSSGVYASFNLGGHVGDDPAQVAVNRALLRQIAGLPSDPVWLKQVHGTDVVDAATAARETVADGAYTNNKGTVCAIMTADCLPVFVCNQAGTEVALLHAGWRGLAAGVIETGLRRFRSAPDELLVWLGPAISMQAYEVGEEVRQAFMTRDAQAADAFRPGMPGKWYMDLYALARHRLTAAGVRSITGGDYCTATQPQLFFSHRRDGTSGRMASLIWIE